MSTQPPWERGVSVSVKQIGRFRWAATVIDGCCRVGEFGGPYAWSRERCIKKAMRVVRRIERDRQRAEATHEDVYPLGEVRCGN